MRRLRTPLCVATLLLVVLSIAQGKTNYAYVANNGANTVSVINTANNTVIKTITVGSTPFAVAVDQPGKFAYVTNYGSANVSVISTATNGVVATIPVGSNPDGIVLAPNGKTAYVANQGSNSVSVINTGTKKVTATITVQNLPEGMALLASGTFLYVVNYQSGSVSVISTMTNAVVATIPVGSNPVWIASSPDQSTAYVTNYAGSVSVIRTADNSPMGSINVPAQAYGDAVSPDGHWLYVASAGVVTVIDTSTQTVAASIPTGGGEYTLVSFSEDSAFAYVTAPAAGSVEVINTSTKTVTATVTVGTTPIGVAVMGTVKVSTVVGGFVGDKGPATSAALGGPYASALDSAGNLYIADVFMNRIRKVTPPPSSNITTYAGTGVCGYNGENVPATKANICTSDGMTFDPSGNLVVSGDLRIRKIDKKTGNTTTIAGTGISGYNPGDDGGPATKAAIGQPFQITYDTAGNMYFDQVGQCVIREVDTSGIIHTVAGNGTCGYNGDNIPAKTAELNLPRGVVVDGSGNVYIGDTGNHRVRKVTPTGIISTFAGTGNPGYSGDGGQATLANIGNPRELTIENGALYITQAGRQRFRSVDLTSNIINTYAGSFYGYDGDGQSLLNTEFTSAFFILFDPSGNPIFDDSFVGRVRMASGGIVNTIAGGFVGDGSKATSAALVFPEGLAIDKSGNMYIADYTGNRVRKVSSTGVMSTIAGVTGISGYAGDGGPGTGTNVRLFAPQGVAVDSTGNVFIADTNNGVIREVNAAGTISTFATNANFSYLLQMTTDSSNNLYVADNGACVVWKITPAAVVSIVAGVLNTCGYNGDGIPATSAQLNGPYSVAVDSHGNFLIADNGNNRIREVNSSGTIATVTGDGNCGYSGNGGAATSAEICLPYGVAVDKAGTVYLSDANMSVRKISGGIITGYAGTGPAGFGFTGDSMWPLLTNFDEPIALALDSKQTLYVLDDFDHRIRKIQ